MTKTTQQKFRTLSLLAIPFALFFLYCFYQITFQDLDVVELLTSESIKRDWMKLVNNRLRMGHPPLYFLSAKLWTTLFSHTTLSLYSFTILTGALGIPLSFLLARELGMGKHSWVAPLIWSIHPSVLYYSRYLRPQIGVAVLCLLYLYLLFQLLNRPTLIRSILFIFVGAVGAFWSHLFLFFWMSLLFTSLLLPSFRRNASKTYWVSLSIPLVIQVGVLLLVRSQSGPIQERLEWVKDPSLFTLHETLLRAFGAIHGSLDWTGFLWLPAVLGLAAIALVYLNKNRSQKWNLLIGSAILTTSIFLIFTFTIHSIWVPRYFVILLPTVILAMAQAIIWFPKQATIVTLAACIWTNVQLLELRKTGLREMISELDQHYDQERDSVLLLSIMTREALHLFAKQPIEYTVINRKAEPLSSIEHIEKKTSKKQRLWVLEYPKKSSFLSSKEWKRFAPEKFHRENILKTNLYGYTLHKNPGQLVILYGTQCAGKSTLAKRIQRELPENFHAFKRTKITEELRKNYIEAITRVRPKNHDDLVLMERKLKERHPHIKIKNFKKKALTPALDVINDRISSGENLVFDVCIYQQKQLERFRAFDPIYVLVYSPLSELSKREIERSKNRNIDLPQQLHTRKCMLSALCQLYQPVEKNGIDILSRDDVDAFFREVENNDPEFIDRLAEVKKHFHLDERDEVAIAPKTHPDLFLRSGDDAFKEIANEIKKRR